MSYYGEEGQQYGSQQQQQQQFNPHGQQQYGYESSGYGYTNDGYNQQGGQDYGQYGQNTGYEANQGTQYGGQQDEWYNSGGNQPAPGGFGMNSQTSGQYGMYGQGNNNDGAFNPADSQGTVFTSNGFSQMMDDSQQNYSGSNSIPSASGVYDDEPPLLEELGINFDHIWTKTSSVLIPTREIKEDILHDTDLAGPLVFCLIQGFCLMFSGKLFFGYVFGFGVVGCICMYLVVNLMNHANNAAIDMYRVFSVLGYCLLPIVALSAFTILFDLRKHSWLGTPLTLIAILWCTQTATRFFEAATQMREQRYLIAYPVFLLYACFALITVF